MTKQQLYVISFILFLITTAASAQVTFTDVAETTGIINLSHIGFFATWCDYDNDGDADIHINAGGWGSRLYRNEGDGTFVDVTITAGINGTGGADAIFLDFDNDGNIDMFKSGHGSTHGDLLYRNLGGGTFLDVSHAAGMESKSRRYWGLPSIRINLR
jgi:hypothetical protein